MLKVSQTTCTLFLGILTSITSLCAASEPYLNITKPLLTIVRTSEDLQTALKTLPQGTTIFLSEGVYTGALELTQNSTLLQGLGEDTILKLDLSWTPGSEVNHKIGLTISGHNCTVQNLKLVSLRKRHITGLQLTGSQNTLSNLVIEGYSTATRTLRTLRVSGGSFSNKFCNLLIKNCNESLVISSDRNIIANTTLENISDRALLLDFGDNNTISNLTCDNCPQGLLINGNDNLVTRGELRNPKKYDSSWGILISSGGGEEGIRLWDGEHISGSGQVKCVSLCLAVVQLT